MNQEQINLVKKSFVKIQIAPEAVAGLFYFRLFETNPDLRPLFKSDINEQGQKLMKMLGLAVKGLDRLEELVPAVQSLGVRHTAYGVQEHHYEAVANALLWTLETVLGEDFDMLTRDAWATVYYLLSETMKNAARQKNSEPAFV